MFSYTMVYMTAGRFCYRFCSKFMLQFSLRYI